MKRILVTGGCGFIGSHTIVDLVENGFEVISADNFINSHEEVLPALKKLTGREIPNLNIDLTDRKLTLDTIEANGPYDAIIHFAAFKSVGESIAKPFKYYQNNIRSLINVAEAAFKCGVMNFIFSSSCTVYGDAESMPVSEESPILPAISPYGLTKQSGENTLKDLARNEPNFRATLLRYFNPAGAHESAIIGEASRNPSTNLVPIICEVAAGKREKLVVYGGDYPTRDGSCIRDFIHVCDLARAHTSALKFTLEKRSDKKVEPFNLGIGNGITVLEAIRAFEKVTGESVNFEIGERRKGDVPAIFSRFDKARKILNWEPQYGVEDIMRSAWKWEQSRFG